VGNSIEESLEEKDLALVEVDHMNAETVVEVVVVVEGGVAIVLKLVVSLNPIRRVHERVTKVTLSVSDVTVMGTMQIGGHERRRRKKKLTMSRRLNLNLWGYKPLNPYG